MTVLKLYAFLTFLGIVIDSQFLQGFSAVIVASYTIYKWIIDERNRNKKQ